MLSRRKNLLRARIKGMLFRRRKRFIRLKASIIFFLIIFTLVFIVPVAVIRMLGSNKDEAEAPKSIYIPYEYLKKAYVKADKENISFSKLLTYSASEAKFVDHGYTNKVLRRAVKAAKKDEDMTEYQENLYAIYSKIFDDLRVGPIPEKKEIYSWDEKSEKWSKKDIREYSYTSVDDFGDARTYGGDRKHEGNDLIADMGTPIVSMTDGEITRLGWNEYGGQRIGITSSKGTYFYYAHMDSYADGIIKGKRVKAGDIIGYIGDTGYGPPGTRGKFIPHLHIQIGFKTRGVSQNYSWFNPYDIIRFLDDHRITLIEKKK